MREILRAKRLVPRHQQQIKCRLLPVREEKILADPGAEHLLHGGAGFDRVGSVVIGPVVGEPQTVEQVVAAQLLVQPLPTHWAAVI